jgi:hypothetical protein
MMTHYLSISNYSGGNNPENHLIRIIVVQTINKLLVTQQIFHRLIKQKIKAIKNRTKI